MIRTSSSMNELFVRAFCAIMGFTAALLLVNYRPIDQSIVEERLLEQIDRRIIQPQVIKTNDGELNELRRQVKTLQGQLAGRNEAPLTANASFSERIQALQTTESQLSTDVLSSTRILCMVLLRPNGNEHERAVMQSWGNRCTKLVFLLGDKELHVTDISAKVQKVYLPIEDNWDGTWIKVRQGIKYINRVYKGQFDWFMRIDDDGFVIMENLILFLHTRDPTQPEMYGVHYKTYNGYIGTGAGLTISAFNFDKLVASLENEGCSKNPTHNDDVEIANCLRTVGVTVADSRDSLGRFRYFPLNPKGTLNKKDRPDWLNTWLKFSMSDGQDCCADDYIGFHYVDPYEMRVLEFLTYVAHPFSSRASMQHDRPDLPELTTTTTSTSTSTTTIKPAR